MREIYNKLVEIQQRLTMVEGRNGIQFKVISSTNYPQLLLNDTIYYNSDTKCFSYFNPESRQIETDCFNGSGGGNETEKRFDYVSKLLYYKGIAPTGSLEDAPVWKIDKVECLANGSIHNITNVTNFKWTERKTI